MNVKQLMAAVFSLLVCAACGDSNTPCEAAAEAFCDRACECTDGDECRTFDGGSSSTSDDRSSCLFFTKGFTCGDEQTQTDEQFDACAAAVGGAMCIEQDSETGMMQVPECQGIFL